MKLYTTNLKLLSILCSLLLITFSCRKTVPQNTSQDTSIVSDTTTLQATPEEEEEAIVDEYSYRRDSPDEQFTEHNNPESKCNRAITKFMESSSLPKEIDLFNIYVHSRGGG